MAILFVCITAGAAHGYGKVLDDFDSYADTSELQSYWTTGGTSTVSLENTIVVDGNSMKYVYDNGADPWWSKAHFFFDESERLQDLGKITLNFKVTQASSFLRVTLYDTDGGKVGRFNYNDGNVAPVGDWVEWVMDVEEIDTSDCSGQQDYIERFDIYLLEGDYGQGTIYFDNLSFDLSYPKEMVLEWLLDENTLDTSGFGNDGAFHEYFPMGYVEGIFDSNGLLFDGSGNELVRVHDTNHLPTNKLLPWSMNIWVYTDHSLSDEEYQETRICSFGWDSWLTGGDGRAIANYTSGIGFGCDDMEKLMTGVPYSVNEWQMVTVTYDPDLWYQDSNSTDGESLKIYKNAKLIGQFNPQGDYYSGGFHDANDQATLVGDELAPQGQSGHDNFDGVLDEFSIWQGVLTPEEIQDMYRMKGDYDWDRDVDTYDLDTLTEAWLDNTCSVLEDFESYADTAAMTVNWNINDYNSTTSIALLSDPNDAHSGNNAITWDYSTDPNTADSYSSIVYTMASPVNLSQYDELRIWVYRHPGNNLEDLLYVIFYDTNADRAAEAWLADPQGSTEEPNGIWDEWVIDLHSLEYPSWSVDPNVYNSLNDITAIQGIAIGCGHAIGAPGGGSGTIDIDDISLLDKDVDLNNDCIVNFEDFAYFAENWLRDLN